MTQPPSSSTRVLVVIVAYDAVSHLAELTARLAATIGARSEWSVLLLDDASADDTSEAARRQFDAAGHPEWQVVRNQENQGYGGNQKIGYRHAVACGDYEYVVLLHGDCQYPPEAMPLMLDKALETGADAVMASRMWSVESARRGGMPLYKIVGNRILTTFQNRLTSRTLSEYHTGMRLYSTKLLARIPFELNSDGFDFDTEILLQSFYVGVRVEEIPIPTRYAGEICRVPGLAYAANITRATFDYWMQTHGMGCSLRFRDLGGDRSHLTDKTQVPGTVHEYVLPFLTKRQVGRVLDLGCGAGFVGSRLKERLPGLTYHGADLMAHPPAACDAYWQIDLNNALPPTDPFSYDAVLCLDLLEHLTEPEQFLMSLRRGRETSRNTAFVFSAVNVAFVTLRLGLLFGRFEYGDRGVLHISHRRLMTRGAFHRLLRESGFTVERAKGIPVPFALVFGDRPWTRLLTRLWGALATVLPGLFAFQTVTIARARHNVPEVSRTNRCLLGEPPAGKEHV